VDDERTGSAAIVARVISPEEYERLGEIGVLGEQVELIECWIRFGRYPFALSHEAIAAARAAGIELAEPEPHEGDGPSEPSRSTVASRAGAPWDPAVIEAIFELAVRLVRVMSPGYVTTWLYTRDIESLGGERPIDVLGRGDIRTVARLASGLGDPGAT
jgi:hypothetical protein